MAIVLTVLLAGLALWRRCRSFGATAELANGAIMAAGFVVIGMQMAGDVWGVTP